MTITKLKETNGEQVRKLLEASGITGIKAVGKRFDMCCPACEKPEAFIDYQGDHRWIKCNRGNNCGYNKGLWEFIAEKQGIDSNNNQKMLEYINYTIGQEFTTYAQDTTPSSSVVVDSTNEELEFLAHCNQIFKNAFKQDTPEVKFVWDYLRNRGYGDEHIKAFNLGYLPNSGKLIETLTASPYSYSKSSANTLVQKYFEGIFSWNERLNQQEESCNRISFTWYDKANNVAGFSFRKPTNQNIPIKYVFNKEAPKSTMLFNIDDWKLNKEKKLVIVEGTFDALAASYLSSEEAREEYHFVAMGGSSLTQGQVELLKSHNVTEAILLIDNDKAGEKYQSSVQKLTQYGINSSIARIPEEAKAKDIDELLLKYPGSKDFDLMRILENVILANNMIINENIMTNENIESMSAEEIEEHQKRKTQLQKELKDNNPIDLHILKRVIDHDTKRELQVKLITDIAKPKVEKGILEQSKQFNDLLAVNYEEDEAYKNSTFLEDLSKVQHGLKTGFAEVDKHVVIQPSTLTFIAGRPSHGKTTVMLNILKNMIIVNPEQAFLFYSYEETHTDIMLKIILSCTADKDAEVDMNSDNTEDSYFAKVKGHLKKYALTVTEDEKGKISSCGRNLYGAYKKLENWINNGNLQIMTRKPNVESLSGSIIERVKKVENKEKDENGRVVVKGKKVAAIFIDYVQKLNTEEEKSNRQQELHKVCKDLLNTACDKRVDAAIILGAQANRDVKSLETFQLDNMREAGDIEQDANLVIGVWDEEAGQKARLEQKLADVKNKIEDRELGFYNKKADKNNYSEIEEKITKKIEASNSKEKELILKILKNRNGQNNKNCRVITYPERFCIVDKKLSELNLDKENEKALEDIFTNNEEDTCETEVSHSLKEKN